MSKREELLKRKQELKNQIFEMEDELKDKTFVSSVDFASIK